MKQRVYIESSMIRYYTARPSRDLLQAARQQITYELWPRMLQEFDCFISDIVFNEIVKGDQIAAQCRINACNEFPVLQSNEETLRLSLGLIENSIIPSACYNDALHMTIATVHGMDYLVSWDFRHLINAIIKNKIEDFLFEEEYEAPKICTIEELMGDRDERSNY